jgi:hypothetical protein
MGQHLVSGEPAELPADLAGQALAFAEQAIGENMRGPGTPFAAPVDVALGASTGDRLVAYLGRSPPQ